MTVIDRSSSQRLLNNVKNGAIGREIFVDESLYQEEQERIFARS